MNKWLSRMAGSALLLTAASCSSSHRPIVADASPGPDGGIANTIQVLGTLLECRGGAPIAGARICIVDRAAAIDIQCATSGDDGSYILAMPAWTTDVDIAFTMSAAGHLGNTELFHETASIWGRPGQSCLYDDTSAAADLMNPAGFAYPAGGKGFVELWVGMTGMSISSSPAGAGPVYLDPTGTPDPTLTAITSNGYALLGNLEPGPIEITLSDASCIPAVLGTAMWADTKPATIAGVTVADSITQMALICNSH